MLQAGRSRFPDEVIRFSNLPNPSSCTMAQWSTQPLEEMSTMNLPGDKGRQGKVVNLTPSVSRLSRENVGVSTPHNHMGLHGLLQG
jgi:hypothetical protein